MTIDELIAQEVNLYIGYCRAAARHDDYEAWYRMSAHAIFYHIQELRQTGQGAPFGILSRSDTST